jgi:hypothetical protein
MMEGSMLFGSLLLVFAGIRLVNGGFRWRDAALLGMAAGFAVATKHNNVFAVVMVFIACLIATFLKGAKAQRITPIFIAGIVSLLVFYAMNPAWWQNPIATATAVINLRTDLLAVQTDVFGQYEGIGEQMVGFWRQIIVGKPMFYEVGGWGDAIGEQIAAYNASLWRGAHLPAWFFAPLALIGTAALMRERTPAQIILLTWAWGVAILTALLTPLEWQRYYLPAVPGLLIVAAHGFVMLANWARLQFEHLTAKQPENSPT